MFTIICAQWGITLCEYQLRMRINREASHSVQSPLSWWRLWADSVTPGYSQRCCVPLHLDHQADKKRTVCGGLYMYFLVFHGTGSESIGLWSDSLLALVYYQAWDRKYLKKQEDNLGRERIDRESRDRSDRAGGGCGRGAPMVGTFGISGIKNNCFNAF